MAEMIRGQWAFNPSEDAPWTLGLAELYSMLPTETHDPSFQPIREKVDLFVCRSSYASKYNAVCNLAFTNFSLALAFFHAAASELGECGRCPNSLHFHVPENCQQIS
jgi:hypothetical protein